MITDIKGDIFSLIEEDDSKLQIIPHVCNDRGGWGAGFVVALSKWDERPEMEYRRISKDPTAQFRLGQTQWVPISKTFYVANMIAQRGYKSEDVKRPLSYSHLIKCMHQVSSGIQARRESIPVEIHTPKFGSGLAGGKWEFIEELIEEIWLPTGAEVYVYSL